MALGVSGVLGLGCWGWPGDQGEVGVVAAVEQVAACGGPVGVQHERHAQLQLDSWGRLPMRWVGKWVAIGYAAFFLNYSTVLCNLPWQPLSWFHVPNLTP